MTLGFRPTTAPDILILADDLTGALESGAAFGQRGIEAAVVWDNPRHLPSTPVLVIDTETRHQDAASAGERIQNLSASIPARVAYKKTDSTLRGNIRAEHVAF